ncbi:MAG: glycoside hydrolase family 127 protein [Anaerolineaceae bacterium]|nr:glycoside hydrolase family 127 protein [Anaerolineaceae bacterium]
MAFTEAPDISHAYTNFLVAAGLKEGEFKGHWWHDGDFYKWIEAAAYVYAVTKDDKLNRLMDEVIDVVGKAQRNDGYIQTCILIGHGFRCGYHGGKDVPFKGKTKPFQDLGDHELYNMGHLMTAACIHFRATGKEEFLNIARKTGDFLYRTFKSRAPRLAHFGFNPSNIMGAVELYRTTGEKKYLDLAGIFVDMRGSQPGGTDQNQDRTPLREETAAVGHAVTANYLYAGAADVYAETGEYELWRALERIWQNVVEQKMYITGGVGPYHCGVSSAGDRVEEAYARAYELPNSTAYNETCANIANAMWNWRMLSITGEERFADIIETVLYNSALSGISLDGKNFYYTNVLRKTKDTPLLSLDLVSRQPYLACFCCPPNIVRTIAKVHGWTYSLSEIGLWVNFYGANVLETKLLDGTKLKLTQITDYPWDGKVKIRIDTLKKKEFSIMLRIPKWAHGATVKINNNEQVENVAPGRYLQVRRTWAKGDVIDIDLPMDVQLIEANPLVEEARNQVAVKRGPIVYCLESPDLPKNIKVSEVMISEETDFKPIYKKDLLGGVTILKGRAFVKSEKNWENKLYKTIQNPDLKSIDIRLIPYFTWGNRGESEMTVWMPMNY